MSKRSHVTALACSAFACGSCQTDEPDEKSDVILLGFMTFDDDVAQSQSDTARLLATLRLINEEGGLYLDGRDVRLDLVTEDHGGTPEGGVSAMRKFAEQGVVAVIGPPWSSLVLGEAGDGSDGAVAVAREEGILLISATATAPQITSLDDDDLLWRTVPSDSFQGTLSASLLYDEQGIESAALLFRDDAWGRGLSGAFRQAFEMRGGSISASLGYDVSQGDLASQLSYDYSQELDEVFADSPQALYLLSFDEFPAVAALIVSGGYLSAYPDGEPVIYVSDSVFDENTLANLSPEILSRLHGTSQIQNEDDPNFIAFATLQQQEGLQVPEIYDAARNDAAFLAALAIQQAGSTDADATKVALPLVADEKPGDILIGFGEWAKARQAILDGDSINYDGPSGPLEFSDAGDVTSGTFVIWSVANNNGDFAFDVSETVTYSVDQE